LPLSEPPPPPPLPFLEELRKSQSYTAIIPKHNKRATNNERDLPNESANYRSLKHSERPDSKNERSRSSAYASRTGGSARIYTKNALSATNPTYQSRHQLRSSLGRAKNSEEMHSIDDASASSEYLFPTQTNNGKLKEERKRLSRQLPLDGVEEATQSSLQDYLGARGGANTTSLISFDPKSSVLLKVQVWCGI